MKRVQERSRFWVPTVVLIVALLTALSTPYLAEAPASNSNRVPKTLWKTYPLDPSGASPRRLPLRVTGLRISRRSRRRETTAYA